MFEKKQVIHVVIEKPKKSRLPAMILVGIIVLFSCLNNPILFIPVGLLIASYIFIRRWWQRRQT